MESGIKGRLIAKHSQGPEGWEYSFKPKTLGADTKTRQGLQSRVYSPLNDLVNRNVLVRGKRVIKVFD